VAAQCYLLGNAGAVHFIVIGAMQLLLRVEEALRYCGNLEASGSEADVRRDPV
jgi:hypothetical protein